MKMRELSPLEIEKWYAVAVGEIGIPPTDFYEMTEDEMDLAYEGYMKRIEDFANAFLLALNRSNTNHKNKLFVFTEEKGYDIGSMNERQITFKNLNIKED